MAQIKILKIYSMINHHCNSKYKVLIIEILCFKIYCHVYGVNAKYYGGSFLVSQV
jgi:hypothetical protein